MPGAGFANHILPFDSHAACACAGIAEGRHGMGRPVSQTDRPIAALALFRGMAVVTRNVHPSDDIAVEESSIGRPEHERRAPHP